MRYTPQWLRNRSNTYLRPEVKGRDTGLTGRYFGDEKDTNTYTHVNVFLKRSTRHELYEMSNEYADNGINRIREIL